MPLFLFKKKKKRDVGPPLSFAHVALPMTTLGEKKLIRPKT